MIFQEKVVPADCELAGWTWLTRHFAIAAPVRHLSCVRRTVEEDLPREIDYLRRHDEALRRIMDVVEMPDRVAEDLMHYIRQNGYALFEEAAGRGVQAADRWGSHRDRRNCSGRIRGVAFISVKSEA